jgi:3-oxoacyl-(acyl-carrier-protein) synthase
MAKVHINGTGCVSAQRTYDSVFLEHAEEILGSNVLPVNEPSYKDYIAPAAARRMAKGVKNAIVASAIALKEAGDPTLDAIITGTGMGCIGDSEKFLQAMIDNDEEFLTPTSFIQSTHNTVGGQIALGLQCKAYNFTYVNGGNSFEAALLDAKMQIEQEESTSILVGAVDENAHFTTEFFKVAGAIKLESDAAINILNSESPGYFSGEGATFFVLESQKSAQTYCEIRDVSVFNSVAVEDIPVKMTNFLQANNVAVSDIDAVILGYNGDVDYDPYYKCVPEKLLQTPQLYYKHLSGEYHTASGFGLWTAAKILKEQQIPEILRVNLVQKKDYKTILLYNQFRGLDHSFTLIRHADAQN